MQTDEFNPRRLIPVIDKVRRHALERRIAGKDFNHINYL